RVFPVQLSRAIVFARERTRLASVPPASADTSTLTRTVTAESLAELIANPTLGDEWAAVERELAALGITELADGINQGDRRALYYLIRNIAPTSVLEVGTHIGASTVHIATALRRTAGTSARLV